jgi:hypothetical protein
MLFYLMGVVPKLGEHDDIRHFEILGEHDDIRHFEILSANI